MLTSQRDKVPFRQTHKSTNNRVTSAEGRFLELRANDIEASSLTVDGVRIDTNGGSGSSIISSGNGNLTVTGNISGATVPFKYERVGNVVTGHVLTGFGQNPSVGGTVVMELPAEIGVGFSSRNIGLITGLDANVYGTFPLVLENTSLTITNLERTGFTADATFGMSFDAFTFTYVI